MGVFGDLPPVAVRLDLAVVLLPALGIPQVVDVIAHGEGELIGCQPLAHQIQGELVRHLPDHHPGFIKGVGTGEHLAGAHAFRLRLVRLDIGHGYRLISPAMVDQEFRVHAEQFIEQFLVVVVGGFADGAPGNVPHGVEPLGLQLFGIARSHPPEVCEGAVIPQQAAVAHLVHGGDTNAALIRLGVLGPDIHGHLRQVQVGSNARRGGNAGGVQHIQHDLPGQLSGGELVSGKVVGHVHQHLVD